MAPGHGSVLRASSSIFWCCWAAIWERPLLSGGMWVKTQSMTAGPPTRFTSSSRVGSVVTFSYLVVLAWRRGLEGQQQLLAGFLPAGAALLL